MVCERLRSSARAARVFEGLNPQEAAYGFHAGEVETALLLSATPELVHTDQYTANYIADINKPELLKPEFSSANFAWLTRDIAESGVHGRPDPRDRREWREVDCGGRGAGWLRP